MTVAGLDARALAAIGAADAALTGMEAAAARGWWALRALGAIALPPRGLWCLASTTHLLAVGGPGWEVLGYTREDVEGRTWSSLLYDDRSRADSQAIVAENVRSHKGVERFCNTYRCADGSPRGVTWRISPWTEELLTVAYGEVDE